MVLLEYKSVFAITFLLVKLAMNSAACQIENSVLTSTGDKCP